MSIGFLGGQSTQKAIDIFSGSASSQIDVSLQSVLSKYDTIKTDLNRLEDSARQNTFNVTSREHYNMYLKESVNGWAETWYSEYKAVLALRADALQKKLQASYNRVLERSAYAQIKPNSESVFAPYANRTFDGSDVTYKMPVSKVLVADMAPGETAASPVEPVTTTPEPVDPGNWTQMIHDYIVAGKNSDETISPYSQISQGYTDKDGDGRRYNTNGSWGVETGADGPTIRDPRIQWGQYPYDSSDQADAFREQNIMTPPWPTYYEKTTGPVPASPIFYVEAKSGSYFNEKTAKLDDPVTVTLKSGSYYNAATGNYYEWDPADTLQGGGFVAVTPITQSVGAHQVSNLGPVSELNNEVVAVTSGGYYNASTYAFVPISTVSVASGQWYKNDGSNPIIVQGTSGAGFTQAGSALTLRKTATQAGVPGYTDVTQTGGYRKKAVDVLGAGWSDITSDTKVRELASINHLGWDDITQDTVWIPDASKQWDLNGDGTLDNLSVLLDPANYGFFIKSEANPIIDPAPGSHGGTGFPADPNVTPDLINPYLYTGSGRGNDYAQEVIYTASWDLDGDGIVGDAGDMVTMDQRIATPGMPVGGHPFIDSRAEAHAILAREAQIDAAIKATDDVIQEQGITDPSVIKKLSELAIDAAISSLEESSKGGAGHPGDPDQVLPFGLGEARNSDGTLEYTIISGWNEHPWGEESVLSPFHMGVDYASADPYNPSTTDGWKVKSGGIYKAVRIQLEIAAQVIAAPPLPGGEITYSSSNYTKSYAGDQGSQNTDGTDERGATYVAGADARGNYKIQVPMFGMGDIPIDFSFLPQDIYDTLLTSPTAIGALDQAIASLQNSFYGQQYDEIVKGNKYDADYMHGSAAILPGWYGSANTGTPIDPPVTLSSQDLIGGALITLAKTLAYGKVDTELAGLLGGTAIQVGGPIEYGHDSWLGGSTGPNLFYGHESAITAQHPLEFGGYSLPSPLGAFSPGLPTIGVFGQHSDFSIPIPIPLPTGPVDVINIPMTIVGNASFDFATMLMNQFLQQIKKPIIEAIQVQSYAASSGTAMDTYASRGEYHFSEPGVSEALKRFGNIKVDWPSPIGGTFFDFSFGEYFDDILFSGVPMNVLGLHLFTLPAGLAPPELDNEINQVAAKERMFDYKHTVQAAESRETEAGAFFATSAFLSQFELSDFESTYWVGTQQNEEIVNADLARAVTTAGKEFLKIIGSALFSYAGATDSGGFTAGVLLAVMKSTLMPALEAQSAEIMFDLMYKDQNLKSERWGFISTIGFDIVEADFTTEGFDYIENDHKPFEGDSDFNYNPSVGPLSFLSKLYNHGTPDFILEGYANTKRFVTTENDSNVNLSNYNQYSSDAAVGFGPRGLAGTGGSAGWWTDTALGDINEVYVGTRTVSFSNLRVGFNEFTDGTINGSGGGSYDGTRSTVAEAERMVGSDSRTFGRRYDAADPVNHETFNTGLYLAGDAKQHYDRRNQYSLNFTPEYGSTYSLFGSQALNPTIGGFIKMAEIDKNKSDNALLAYDASGVSGMTYNANDQQFGADPEGTLNELNRVLYEHMHLRADGRNLSMINEYRDVFNTGLIKNMFISGQTYHPSGGGITSSIEIRFDPTSGVSNVQGSTRENSNPDTVDIHYVPFLTKTKGVATIYLNSYFAHKKRAANKKT